MEGLPAGVAKPRSAARVACAVTLCHNPMCVRPPSQHARFALPAPSHFGVCSLPAEELAAVKAAALEAGAAAAVTTNHHALGGAGALELGEAVIKACAQQSDFSYLYDVGLSIKVGGSGCLSDVYLSVALHAVVCDSTAV